MLLRERGAGLLPSVNDVLYSHAVAFSCLLIMMAEGQVSIYSYSLARSVCVQFELGKAGLLRIIAK